MSQYLEQHYISHYGQVYRVMESARLMSAGIHFHTDVVTQDYTQYIIHLPFSSLT